MSDIDRDLIVTQQDIIPGGACFLGARRWFRRHGLDFRKFLREGIDAEALLSTGCAKGARVVEAARGRQKQ